MNYSPRHYAQALYEALHEKKVDERRIILQRFASLLIKNKQFPILPLILTKYEKIYLEKNGITKVAIETTQPLSKSLKKDLENIFGLHMLLEEHINPELGAGITILINDSLSIDASARKLIGSLFT